MTSNLAVAHQTLLSDPAPTADLDQLARELNELAQIRQTARLAFCRRLAAAYLLLVGHRPNRRSSDGRKFRAWCDAKIRAANGKKYSHRTIELYLIIGFSKNPEAIIRQRTDDANDRAHEMRRIGAALSQAIRSETAPKPIPVRKLKTDFGLPGAVASEVNELMRAWENASPDARAQFIYQVTGKRLGNLINEAA